MNRDSLGQDRAPRANGRKYEFLERITAVVLAIITASLAWMLLAGSEVAWVRLFAEKWEVAVILGLFTTALVLVSVLALLKSRD